MIQEDQNLLDDEARKKAMRNLVNSWQERLQLISVIVSNHTSISSALTPLQTTFFASIEAGILVNMKPLTSEDQGNNTLKALNASLLGALVMHVYASM